MQPTTKIQLLESRLSPEAIELCFGEEIEEVARTMREAFGQVRCPGAAGLGCRACDGQKAFVAFDQRWRISSFLTCNQ